LYSERHENNGGFPGSHVSIYSSRTGLAPAIDDGPWSAQIRLLLAVLDVLIQNIIASEAAANFVQLCRHDSPGLDAGGVVFLMDAGDANLDLILPKNGFISFSSTPGFPGLIPCNYTEDLGSY
jgi:hypothetical protein